jgi:5-methylcytosine-specific restriction endonuclease McrA
MIDTIKNIFKKESHQEWSERNAYKLAKWSKLVRAKYNHTCVACGYKPQKANGEWLSGIKLEAHHIIPKSKSRKLALKISNGVALCEVCHRTGDDSYHAIHGVKGSKRMFNRWLRAKRGKGLSSSYLRDISIGVAVLIVVALVAILILKG